MYPYTARYCMDLSRATRIKDDKLSFLHSFESEVPLHEGEEISFEINGSRYQFKITKIAHKIGKKDCPTQAVVVIEELGNRITSNFISDAKDDSDWRRYRPAITPSSQP